MWRKKRVKRRVLRQAVRENVDVMNGRLPGRARRRRRRLVTGVLAAAVGLVATYLLAAVGPERLAELAERASALGRSAVSGTPGRAAADGGAFEVPSTAPTALSREVFPLRVRKVVIDPGHGGNRLGTLGPDGLIEKDIALDIAGRLAALLEGDAFDVEMTRREDRNVELEDRARLANERRGDIFVSIHLNWIEQLHTRGVETYYLGATDDPFLTALAATENRESGYSMADYRRLLEQVYANARQDESRRLAAEVQGALYASLRKISPDLQNRGVKQAPFMVLTETEMPAILAEVSCLSNEEEARLLKLDEYRQYIAEALYAGIDAYAERLNGLNDRGS